MPDDCRIPRDDPAHPTYAARRRKERLDELAEARDPEPKDPEDEEEDDDFDDCYLDGGTLDPPQDEDGSKPLIEPIRARIAE